MVLLDMVRRCVCGCVGSCAGYFWFHVLRGAGWRPRRLTNKEKRGGEGKIRTILFYTKNLKIIVVLHVFKSAILFSILNPT
jgi:hypothetical protein